MDLQKLPNNIKSIIINIDNELKENFYSLVNTTTNKLIIDKKINQFLDLIITLIKYYFDALYKRVYTNTISIEQRNFYYPEINDFINNLTSFIYETASNKSEQIYNRIITSVALFIISAYVQLQIDKANDDTTVYIIPNSNANEYVKNISNLITNVKELSLFKDKLNLLEVTIIFVTSFKDFTINGLTFKHVPIGIQSVITSTLIKISNDWITPKIITFVANDEYQYQESSEVFINYKTDLHTLQYNIIYALIKDKLLARRNIDYWQQAFIQSTNNKFVADGCIIPQKYLYSLQSEIDTDEYFLSCGIAFILQPEQLQIIDYNQYRRLELNNF